MTIRRHIVIGLTCFFFNFLWYKCYFIKNLIDQLWRSIYCVYYSIFYLFLKCNSIFENIILYISKKKTFIYLFYLEYNTGFEFFPSGIDYFAVLIIKAANIIVLSYEVPYGKSITIKLDTGMKKLPFSLKKTIRMFWNENINYIV